MSDVPLLSDEVEAFCRVCHLGDTDDANPLLSPCLCDGSVRYVHRSCLNTWRVFGASSTGRAARCELCGLHYRYELRRTSRCEAIRELSCYCAGVSGVVAAVATVVASVSSLRTGFLAAGIGLGLWALRDAALGVGPSSTRVGSTLAVAVDQCRVAIGFVLAADTATQNLVEQEAVQAAAAYSVEERAWAASLLQEAQREDARRSQVLGTDEALTRETVNDVRDTDDEPREPLFWSGTCCAQLVIFLVAAFASPC
eukprot:gnl/TRDRNA2_/TRDRNA2_91042_c0_seq2.p1 gnl/TRDRNA2_/TRDRNA2_91042_c0~~gnl/TRDRNA2_/TRDRNA2_91042_c0_seq2.p1  ORF type:complete len:255 (+),score=21.27 gnl/TRDRNA2_/TRDRNA2_91042_c0_seq2:98-862(+)